MTRADLTIAVRRALDAYAAGPQHIEHCTSIHEGMCCCIDAEHAQHWAPGDPLVEAIVDDVARTLGLT